MTEERNTSNKLALYLILGIPLLGIALTTLFYFYVKNYGIELDTNSEGVLIHPPKYIEKLELNSGGNDKYHWLQQDKKWSFMIVATPECDAGCQDKLYFIRQMRKAMGKYSLRMENVYLNLGQSVSKETRLLLDKEYPLVRVINVDPESAKTWFASKEPRLDIEQAGKVYVVDPSGWVMMYYTEGHTYKQIIRDMKFLLKNS